MRKLDLYIIKKFLGTFFFAISLLIVIVVIFDVSEKIDDFIEKEAPLSAIIFSYYFNFIPYFVNLFSYLFTFIAVIFFTSKMASDSEIVAILSSGISFRRFLLPYIISAVVLGVLSFYLTNFLIPVTNKKMMAFEKVYIKNPFRNRNINIHMQVEPGIFVYMESFNAESNVGYKFSMEQFRDRRLVSKVNADRILWDSATDQWKLKNYFIREFDGFEETLIKGREMDTVFNMQPKEFKMIRDDIKTLNYSELRQYIAKEKLKGSANIQEFIIEKHNRIAFPFATIVLTLIGVSLSSRKVRGGIGVHLGFGIALTFSYILFMQISNVFATRGNLSPMIAAWIPNIIFGIIAIYLIRIAPK